MLASPIDGGRMVFRWRRTRKMATPKKRAEVDKSEKITINVGLVDLGQIDLLVNEGFFANRTDFIRTAIRRQLESRSSAVDSTVARRELTLGSEHYSRHDLEVLRRRRSDGRVARPRVGEHRRRRLPRTRPSRRSPRSRSLAPSGRLPRSRQHSHRARDDGSAGFGVAERPALASPRQTNAGRCRPHPNPERTRCRPTRTPRWPRRCSSPAPVS